jgi:predicted regulator of Ras-like GTPase activity (Roadblock/LC7/MglB family)/ferredoxin
MSKITVPSVNAGFDTSGSTILHSALTAGLSVPYGCRIGTCGRCKAKVLQGQVQMVGDYDPNMLTEEEQQQNLILSCRTIALTDITVEWLDNSGPSSSNENFVEDGFNLEEDLFFSNAPVLTGDDASYSKNPITTINEDKQMVRDVPDNNYQPMNRTDKLNKILRTLQNGSPDLEATALISEDGLMIASALPQGLDETRVAGMSATLLSLGTRAAAELGRGNIQEVIVRGNQGYTVMVGAGRGVLLLAITNESAKLGLVFFDMHETIKDINRVL